MKYLHEIPKSEHKNTIRTFREQMLAMDNHFFNKNDDCIFTYICTDCIFNHRGSSICDYNNYYDLIESMFPEDLL